MYSSLPRCHPFYHTILTNSQVLSTSFAFNNVVSFFYNSHICILITLPINQLNCLTRYQCFVVISRPMYRCIYIFIFSVCVNLYVYKFVFSGRLLIVHHYRLTLSLSPSGSVIRASVMGVDSQLPNTFGGRECFLCCTFSFLSLPLFALLCYCCRRPSQSFPVCRCAPDRPPAHALPCFKPLTLYTGTFKNRFYSSYSNIWVCC